MAFALFLGFLLGAAAVVALECLGLYLVVQRLIRKKVTEVEQRRDLVEEQQPLNYPFEKQGVVWIWEQSNLPKIKSDPQIKEPKELKNNKEIIEVSPIKKNAKIKDHSLLLTGQDGCHTCIPLLDCSISAVSSSNLPSRKWYRRYPVRIESKNTIYNGKKICYLYFETSSEKEAWCKALRLASFSDKMIVPFAELHEGFITYLAGLAPEYPLFHKPAIMAADFADKNIKIDESSSKVRHFFKKFARKASRVGSDCKANNDSLSTRGDKKVGDKLRNTQNASSTSVSTKSVVSEKSSIHDVVPPPSPKSARLADQHHPTSDSLLDENASLDEGTICLNMLLARLFFDAKRSVEINNLIITRLQKTLSNMRTPSFIGGITCTGLNVGNLPPYIHQMRTLPVDMREMCAMEIDIEYNGGFLIEIETRLEVREPEFQGIVDTSLEQGSVEDAASDLLNDFESYNNQMNISDSTSLKIDKQTIDGNEGLKQTKSTSWASTYKSRWKTMVNSIADHVSQVPISLAIKVASLRGTLCLRIKPPPSDQIWYGFTSMPDIDFVLDSSFGDHKISSTHVGLIIANRLKVAVRESIVLPNCESICIPWMSAEKDDWLPRSAAPYIWLGQENDDLSRKTPVSAQVPAVSKSKSENYDVKRSSSSASLNVEEKRNSSGFAQPSLKEEVLSSAVTDIGSTSFSSDESCSKIVQEDLKVPLLEKHDDQVSRSQSIDLAELTERPCIASSREPLQPTISMQEDLKSKSFRRRDRFRDLGKRMGEKLEEKRRHIEEKGRHMVEKLRENSRGASEGGSVGGSFSSGSFKV